MDYYFDNYHLHQDLINVCSMPVTSIVRKIMMNTQETETITTIISKSQCFIRRKKNMM